MLDTAHSTHRTKLAKGIIWFGLLAPLAVSEFRQASEVAADPITVIAVFRGATPILCLAMAVALLRPRLRVQGSLEGIAVVFASVAVLSTTWSIAPTPTLLKAAVLAASYGLAILLVRTWTSLTYGLGEATTAIQAIVVSALVGGLVAPNQAFRDPKLRGELVARLYGVFPEIHPVPLGWLSLVALLVSVAGIGRWSWQRYPATRAILGVAAIATLLLTRTRGPLLIAPFVFVLYGGLRRRRMALAGIAVVGVLTATLVAFVPGVRTAAIDAVYRGQGPPGITSLGGRLPVWQLAVNVWSERPVLGYGYYSGHRFGPYANALAGAQGEDRLKDASIDSAYLETALDLGLIGLAPLLALISLGMYQLVRQTMDSSSRAVMVLPVTIVLVVESILSYSLQTVSYQGQFLLMLLLGSRLPLIAADPVGDVAAGSQASP